MLCYIYTFYYKNVYIVIKMSWKLVRFYAKYVECRNWCQYLCKMTNEFKRILAMIKAVDECTDIVLHLLMLLYEEML